MILDLHGRVPDARTIWSFRELPTRARAIEAVLSRFDAHLGDRGYFAMGGQGVVAALNRAIWSDCGRRRFCEVELWEVRLCR